MPPTAHAGTAPAAYNFAALPVNVPLNGTASTVGAGAASIDEWVWALKARPTGSTATIVGGSTPTPVLTGMDKPGGYVIWLRVRNNLNEWSAGVSAGDDGGDFPDAWSVMPTSIIVVEAKTANLDLVIKAESEHEYWEKDEAWFLAVDALKAQSDSTTFPVSPYTKWVQAHDGEEDADGSMARPFNPLSAAAEGYNGPWDQAIAALSVLDVSDEPRAGLTIMALGGVYNENVAILLAKVPWTIIKLGDVVFNGANSITYTADVTANLLASPHLTIDGPGSFVATGAWAFGNPSAEAWQITVRGPAVIGPVSVSGSFLTGPAADLEYATFTGTVNVPNLSLSHLEWTQFPSALTCKNVQRAINCKFDDVTVTQAATVGEGGFFSCAWVSAAVFDGPAGSAKFDPVTAGLFAQALCTYAGAATDEDTLYVGNVVQADEMLVRSNAGLILEATTADLRGSALAGDVDFLARGAGNFAKYASEDGDVWLDQNGATRKVDIDAEGDLDVDVDGDASIEADGALVLAAGVLAGTASLTGHTIQVSAPTVTSDIEAQAGRDMLLLAGTGPTAGLVTIRGGTGYDLRLDDIERDTVDGGVEVHGRGTHSYDLQAAVIRVDNINSKTGDALTVGDGTGQTDDVLLWPSGRNQVVASRISECLDSQYLGTSAPTTGTSEELLDSYTVADDFFTIPGMMMRITSYWAGDNNANSKTYAIKLDGVDIVTMTETTNNDRVKIVVDVYAGSASFQRNYAFKHKSGGAAVESIIDTAANMAGGDKVIGFYGTTPTASGDLELQAWTIEHFPTRNT